ncbi:MAG: RNA polymerase sigma factor [Planctomycetes bacterium]|nr:RNA polymerase sigma factor [Planctomycetota bacterium]
MDRKMSAGDFDESLLASHAAGLRSLALSILRDREAAEDVVQETWRRALVAPAPAGEGLAGWLRAVARGLALNRLRDDRHRRERETAAVRESVREREAREHDDEERRAAALRSVVDAVLLLDESYRRVILARYFDGLEPTEIAARTGAPVATITTRLKRARERLRAKLEKDFGPRAGGLPGALALVAGLDPRSVATSNGPVPIATGTKLAAAAALVLLAATFVFWFVRETAPSGAATGGDAELTAEAHASEPAELARAADASSASAATSAGSALPASTADEHAELAAGLAPRAAPPRDEAETPALRKQKGPFLYHLVVETLDRDLHPMGGAFVLAAPKGVTLNDVGVTGWNGKLELEWRGFEPVLELELLAREPDEGSSALVRVSVHHDRTVATTLALRPPPAAKPKDAEPDVEPRVTRARERARDAKRRKDGAHSVDPTDAADVAPAPRFELDALGNGVFVDPNLLAEVGPGAPRVEVRGVKVPKRRERARTLRSRDDEGAREWEQALRELGGRAEFDLLCHDALGAPLPDVPVSLAFASPAVRIVARSDAKGRVRFYVPYKGNALVSSGGGRYLRIDAALRIGPEGVRLAHRHELAEPMPLRLVDAAGVPRADWVVEAWSVRGDGAFVAQARTDASGGVVLGVPPGGPWRLLARRLPASVEVARLVHDAAWASSKEQFLTNDETEGMGFLQVRFSGVGGRLLEHPSARLWDPRSGQGLVLGSNRTSAKPDSNADAEHVFRSPELQSGIYWLEAGGEGQRWSSFGEVRVPAGKALDLGRVAFRDNALLEVGPGALPEGLDALLEFRALRHGAIVRAPDLAAKLPVRFDAAPGRCELVVHYTQPAASAVEPARSAAAEPPSPSEPSEHVREAVAPPEKEVVTRRGSAPDRRTVVFPLDLGPSQPGRVELPPAAPRPSDRPDAGPRDRR